jgi:hypothetical protein
MIIKASCTPAQIRSAQNDQRHDAYWLMKPPTSGPSSGLSHS